NRSGAYEQWRRDQEISDKTRVFAIYPTFGPNHSVGGSLHALKRALEAYGWHFNDDSTGIAHAFWDLKFGLKVSDIGTPPSLLNDRFTRDKVINFFGQIADLTTKLGLQRSIEKFTRRLTYP
ncbi:unnamed protein product, partial [Amoebophrya sp. A25]